MLRPAEYHTVSAANTNHSSSDFWILASGDGTYASAAPALNTSNPPRRDVAMLPGSGYLVIALIADNPGAWVRFFHSMLKTV